jgi:excisionase family DNA binding protein
MARLEIMGPEPDVVACARALLAVEETSGVWNPRITVGEVTVDLPGPLAELLRDVLVRARALETVGVVSLHEEITSQDVADLLGTSRPYAVGLLDAGTIPCRRLGSHRRARLADVLTYRDARDRHRRSGLDQMYAEEVDAEASALLAGEPPAPPYSP